MRSRDRHCVSLQTLGEGLTRMRRGDYGHVIPAAGPPEIRHSREEANELARTLQHLIQDTATSCAASSRCRMTSGRACARVARRARPAAVQHLRRHHRIDRDDGRSARARAAIAAIGRSPAADQPPHPRPVAAALHPGARARAQHRDAVAEFPQAGAGDRADDEDRSGAEPDRRPAVAKQSIA